jgi:chemotaxis protein histidine kinase CheA
MSGPAGFLEFFILEASDYVEQLDRMLLGGNSSGLDAEGVQRIARALRGTATMAKMPSFAELASGVERAGRALQEGAVQWSPALGGVLVAAIDDLKALLHSARSWSPADDQRATARAA